MIACDAETFDRLRDSVRPHNVLRRAGVWFDLSQRVAEFLRDSRFGDAPNEDITRKLSDIIVVNKEALVIGEPGTWKRKLLNELIRTWKQMCPKTNFVCRAYAHAASRPMPGGRTLEHSKT